jgi:hypothetical protein
LEYAMQRANELGQRLLVVFGLTDGYPEANLRHYAFLLEGLQDVEGALKERSASLRSAARKTNCRKVGAVNSDSRPRCDD